MADVSFDHLTILLIDDEPFMRSALERVFSELGSRSILNAENGEDGLRAVRTRRQIDLIICDLDMPIMGGLEFVRELRGDKDPGIAETPVLILSGRSDEDDIAKALAQGINGFLVKPVSKGELVSRVIATLNAPPIDPKRLGDRE